MYKASIGKVPSQFSDLFVSNRDVHNYCTRNATNYHLYNPILTITHRSIRHAGPDVWNSLSNDIKNRPSVLSFRMAMKKNLIKMYKSS